MAVKLTQPYVEAATAAPGAERTIFWDAGLKCFGLMVTARGARSYVVQYRADGISRRFTISANYPLSEARKRAKRVLGEVARGADPVAEKRKAKARSSSTVKAVAEDYLDREGKKLRSIKERRRIFDRYLYPTVGHRQINELRRSEIVRLLDRIEDQNGPVMADHTLAVLRRLMSWHASRTDEFRSPIVRGMARTTVKERARERVLSDEELRIIWKAAETSGTAYGYLLRFILLTATRLREAAHLNRRELNQDSTRWVIPGSRHKSKRDFLLPLTPPARMILVDMPAIGQLGWVFTTDGERPLGGFSKFKRQFDAQVMAILRMKDPDAEPLPRWTTHDLRRTARSLMSRGDISPDHAERALGHVIGGVRGTYDRHEFVEEKARAFAALASQISLVLNKSDTASGSGCSNT